MAKLKISAKSGNAAGFSNIPGATNYSLQFGKQFVGGFKKGVKAAGPVKPKGGKPKDEVIQDPAPQDTDGEPTTPKPPKKKSGTVADVETAVRKGYITPEEATGGGVKERWYESEGFDSSGKQIYGKPTKVEPVSKNYATKLGRAQAESQATGNKLGKQFTGPQPGRETAPIWDSPKSSDGSYVVAPEPSSGMLSMEANQLAKSKGNSNRGKQFP